MVLQDEPLDVMSPETLLLHRLGLEQQAFMIHKDTIRDEEMFLKRLRDGKPESSFWILFSHVHICDSICGQSHLPALYVAA